MSRSRSFLRRIFLVFVLSVSFLVLSASVFQYFFLRQSHAIEEAATMNRTIAQIQSTRDALSEALGFFRQFDPATGSQEEALAVFGKLQALAGTMGGENSAELFLFMRAAVAAGQKASRAQLAQAEILARSADEELEARLIENRKNLEARFAALEREKDRPWQVSLSLSLLLFTVLSALGAWALHRFRFFSREVERFSSRLSAGEWDARTGLFYKSSGDELDGVSRALNVMSDRLQSLYAEVERSNQDLEQFALMISHDLRTPLRHIRAFSEDLKGDAAQKESVEAIQLSTRRLTQLIDDLLEFCKVKREGLQPERFDFSAAAFSVARDVGLSESQLSISAAGEVEGIKSLIQTAFQNLMENSVKYHPSRENLKISISVAKTPNGWLIEYRDNGPGIPEHELERVFSLFGRLEREADKPGFGVGLALVKKIAGWHGGDITARGCVSGAHFVMTIKDQGLMRPSSGEPVPSPISPP